MARRILIVGPSSGLAEEFVLGAPAGWVFEGVGRRNATYSAHRYETIHLVDARDIGPLEFAVRANDCETVLSFLQEGDRDRCDEERPGPGALPAGVAWEVNVLATEAIGRAAVSEHKRVIVVSTDEVFPGAGGPAAESVAPLSWRENPSWYGGTWAEAETLLSRLPGSVAILRVSALFGWSHAPECDRRLVDQLSSGRGGEEDLVQPTFVRDAIGALRLLVENPVSGDFHVAVREPVRRRELVAGLLGSVAGMEAQATGLPERHPGLVPGKLNGLGLRFTTVAEALESLPGSGSPT